VSVDLERREEVRDQLLVAAERLLAGGDGYAELGVDRLVAEAGVGRSTFYKYFSDKGDLLRAWFELISAELAGVSASWLALGPGVTFAAVRDALAQLVEAYRPHASLMAVLYDVARFEASVAAAVTEVEARGVAELERHIRDGQDEGWVDPELLAPETAAWLSWLGENGQHRLLRRAADEERIGSLIDAYARIVWSTLYAFAPARVAAA
jgi:AcrR family transcriptional regulator